VPELPEVEIVRRGLNQATLGQIIWGGEVLLDRTIAHPISSQIFLQGLQETAIACWHRRGKYLLAQLVQAQAETTLSKNSHSTNDEPISTTAGWLGVHLRMTGQLLWVTQAEPVPKHCRVRLFFEQGRELRFVDQRTFGQMWWIPPGITPEAVMTGLQQLGPEPLSADFSTDYLASQLQHRQRSIKSALLDQTLIAGIGNIYADEALFLSNINPTTRCSDLKSSQIERLHAAILQVLQAAIASRGTTFRAFRDVEGINGNYAHVAWVYDREGDPCRVCETPITRIKLAGRSAHFCSNCQGNNNTP
jgi:formamidopyrimidine-DNA glycosylase